MSNDTKIKYLKVMNKLYQVTRISFYYMIIEATETDLSLDDVPPDEVWDIEDFKNYKIRLINNGGQAEIIGSCDRHRQIRRKRLPR